MKEEMTSLSGKTEASVIPIEVSFRGIVLTKNAELMTSELKLSMSNLELLVLKTLNLTNGILGQFKRSTARLHEARRKRQDKPETAPGFRMRHEIEDRPNPTEQLP